MQGQPLGNDLPVFAGTGAWRGLRLRLPGHVKIRHHVSFKAHKNHTSQRRPFGLADRFVKVGLDFLRINGVNSLGPWFSILRIASQCAARLQPVLKMLQRLSTAIPGKDLHLVLLTVIDKIVAPEQN